jgi:hypothetical protein
MPRFPLSLLKQAWQRYNDHHLRRLEERGVTTGGKTNPEYVDSLVARIAWVFGAMGVLYIGAHLHLIAFCLLLNLILGLGLGIAWRSGTIAPLAFGRGWRPVKIRDDAGLYWFNMATLVALFSASVVFTGWAVIRTIGI